MGAPKADGKPAATREFPGSWAAKFASEFSLELTKLLKLNKDDKRFELPIPILPMFPNDAELGKMVPDEGKRFINTWLAVLLKLPARLFRWRSCSCC